MSPEDKICRWTYMTLFQYYSLSDDDVSVSVTRSRQRWSHTNNLRLQMEVRATAARATQLWILPWLSLCQWLSIGRNLKMILFQACRWMCQICTSTTSLTCHFHETNRMYNDKLYKPAVFSRAQSRSRNLPMRKLMHAASVALHNTVKNPGTTPKRNPLEAVRGVAGIASISATT